MSNPSLAELKTRRRADYPFRLDYRTRWVDNDQYAHLNNAIYGHLFDSVINNYLAARCGHTPAVAVGAGSLSPASPASPQVGFVVRSEIAYLKSARYPGVLDVGLRVRRLGGASVEYECAVFDRRDGEPGKEQDSSKTDSDKSRTGLSRYKVDGVAYEEDAPCAVGSFVHVFVERESNRPAKDGMTKQLRDGLEELFKRTPKL